MLEDKPAGPREVSRPAHGRANAIYQAVGIGKFVNQRHAGMYIGDGEFVHAMKGSAVTISRLSDARWRQAYVLARRFDPEAIARAEEAHAAARSTAPAAGTAVNTRPADRVAADTSTRHM